VISLDAICARFFQALLIIAGVVGAERAGSSNRSKRKSSRSPPIVWDGRQRSGALNSSAFDPTACYTSTQFRKHASLLFPKPSGKPHKSRGEQGMITGTRLLATKIADTQSALLSTR